MKVLQNDWACAAFALDPINRVDGLRTLFETYAVVFPDAGLESRFDEVVVWIQESITEHTPTSSETSTAPVNLAASTLSIRRKNAFASRTPTNQSSNGSENDPWELYNDSSRRFLSEAHE